MSAIIYETCGFLGACLIGTMMFPQIYRTMTTQKSQDISVTFLAMNLVAASLLIPYAAYFKLYPVIIANCSVATCNIVLLCFRLKQVPDDEELQIANRNNANPYNDRYRFLQTFLAGAS